MSELSHSAGTIGTVNKPGSALLLLVAQAFFVGLAFGLLYNVAYTKLVIAFGSSGLRLVYVLVGVTVPLFTVGFNTLEEKLHLARFSVFTIAVFALLFFVSFVLVSIPGLTWAPFFLMVVNIMGALYCMMLRGSQAAEIYDARAIKKNYPRITGGEILAVVLAGLLIGPLTELTGSLERLLILGGISMLAAFFVVVVLVRREIAPIEAEHALHVQEKNRGHHESELAELLIIIRKRYTLLVFAYQLTVMMVSLLVQYLVYSEARYFFPTQTDMSQFIGLIKAGTTGVSFLFLTFATGKLLIRFGMPLGLAGSPVGVAVVLVAAVIAGMVENGGGRIFFIVIVVSQFVDYMLYSGFAKTSIQSAFQPLPPKERDAVHAFAQGIGIPVSYGLTGLLLIAFSAIPGYTTHHAVYLTLAVIAACGAVAFFLYRSYSDQLRSSLSKRSIEEMELNLEDASTMEIVNRLLESTEPGLIKIGLDLLEKSGHPDYEARLQKLSGAYLGGGGNAGADAGSSGDDILTDLLYRVEKLKPVWGQTVAEKTLESSYSNLPKAAAVTVLCATSEEPVALVAPFLKSKSPKIRSSAVSGLFLYGGIKGILQAGNVFNRMVASKSARARLEAANILEKAGINNFYHPVLDLLQDKNNAVRRAALKAAGKVRHPVLIQGILPLIDRPATRAEALTALVEFGADVKPLLQDCLNDGSSIPRHRALRIIRACSRIPDAVIGETLEGALNFRVDEETRAQVYSSLSRRGFRAAGETRVKVKNLILHHAKAMARAILAVNDLSLEKEKLKPLISGLNDFSSRNLENVFQLCTLIYNSNDILGIQRKILEGTEKQKALGAELLDVVLGTGIKQPVMAVAEHFSCNKADTEKLMHCFKLEHQTSEKLIKEILYNASIWPGKWLRVCALHGAWTLGISSRAPEESMLTIIERVLALKAADIFSAIPDAVLAHVAKIAEYIDIPAKETFIRKGEIGDCMYIIQGGLVSIHDGDTKFAELSSGKVVGEMAVLDPEPRSASATAIEDTSVLRIDKDSFDSIMVDHPGIARSVIKVLCQRLRTTTISQSKS